MDISLYMICKFCITYPIFYISKTDKILQFFSQFSRKFLQNFLGNRFTCMRYVIFALFYPNCRYVDDRQNSPVFLANSPAKFSSFLEATGSHVWNIPILDQWHNTQFHYLSIIYNHKKRMRQKLHIPQGNLSIDVVPPWEWWYVSIDCSVFARLRQPSEIPACYFLHLNHIGPCS